MVSIADVFAAHQPRIRRYVLSLVRDPAEADDLTQEVFLRAHRKLGSLRDPDLVLPWLYRVATNVCHDRFRQRARQPQLDGSGPDDQVVADATPESGAPVDVEREAVRSEMSACVQGYVSELSDGYRQVILLHDAEGLTNPEIAEMLGVSVDAVKIRLHRARRGRSNVVQRHETPPPSRACQGRTRPRSTSGTAATHWSRQRTSGHPAW